MTSSWGIFLDLAVAVVIGGAFGAVVTSFVTTDAPDGDDPGAAGFLVVVPQLLLCGLLVPTDPMPTRLEWIAWTLPLTYGYPAMTLVVSSPAPQPRFWFDIAMVAVMSLALLAAGVAALRRRTR